MSRGEAERGLLVCGSGQGMAMAANRYRGVRAALAADEDDGAALSREHNDANVLALGARGSSTGVRRSGSSKVLAGRRRSRAAATPARVAQDRRPAPRSK